MGYGPFWHETITIFLYVASTVLSLKELMYRDGHHSLVKKFPDTSVKVAVLFA